MPKVIVSIEGVIVKEVTLAKDRTTLGRRPYNDIVIDNLAISGEHAVLHMIGQDVYLEDLNSTNGTYVNTRAIKRQALEHNDVIEVGKFKLRYLSDGQPLDATPREPTVIVAAPEPMVLSMAPTELAGLGDAPGPALVRVLSGVGVGFELPLRKVVTTVGKPGVAVAAVTRRLKGYVVTSVEGLTTVNGEPLGAEAVALQDGDVLVLAGARMQFTHV